MIRVIDSFKVTGRGIIAVLQSTRGLPDGVMLRNTESGKRWKVKHRISHNLFESPLQEGQYIWSTVWWHFKDAGSWDAAKNKVLKEEWEGIFHYALDSILHEDKPQAGTALVIED